MNDPLVERQRRHLHRWDAAVRLMTTGFFVLLGIGVLVYFGLIWDLIVPTMF